MAHIDCQVDLLTLDDLELTLVFLHIDGNEFVADFWSMFCRVHHTEWLHFKRI